MDEKKKKILDTAKIQDELKNQATDLGKAAQNESNGC